MDLSCEVVRDLMPLVHDGVASADSRAAVEAHIRGCAECRAVAQRAEDDVERLLGSDAPDTGANAHADATPSTDDAYAAVARRLRYRKAWRSAAFAALAIVVVLTAVAYVGGVRPTAMTAAMGNAFVMPSAELLTSVDIGSSRIFFFDNGPNYESSRAQRFGPLWKTTRFSFHSEKNDDAIRIVGWWSQADETAVPLQVVDDRVAYIEMGPIGDRQHIATPTSEIIVFVWERGFDWNDLDGIAYANDGTPLYQLGYEVRGNTILQPIRWLPIE